MRIAFLYNTKSGRKLYVDIDATGKTMKIIDREQNKDVTKSLPQTAMKEVKEFIEKYKYDRHKIDISSRQI